VTGTVVCDYHLSKKDGLDLGPGVAYVVPRGSLLNAVSSRAREKKERRSGET
jgi:hypothetical protein